MSKPPEEKKTTPGEKLIAETVRAIESEKHREEIYRWLLDGFRRAQILDKAERDQWAESEADIDELIAEATDRLVKAATINPDAEMGIAILRLQQLYRDAGEGPEPNRSLQLSVQKEINRLFQLKIKAAAVAAKDEAVAARSMATHQRFTIVR